MTLWLVGRVHSGSPQVHSWEYLGVFSSPEKAEARCTTDNDFVAEIEVDVPAPEATKTFPKYYYPKLPF